MINVYPILMGMNGITSIMITGVMLRLEEFGC